MAYRIDPVPRVAMKESIWAASTSNPLIVPTVRPIRSTASTASGHGTPNWTCRPIARMWARPTPKPIDRSNLLVDRGIMAASERKATIDLSLRIARRFRAVGYVDGSNRLKKTISRTVKSRRP